MKLKSYLRGIGAGILVTAAVFLVAGRNDGKSTMTDAQIIARAKELGMIEATTVADVGKQKNEAVENEAKPVTDVTNDENQNQLDTKLTEETKPTEEAKPTEVIKPTEEAKPTEIIKPTEKAKPTKEVKPTTEAKENAATENDDKKVTDASEEIVIVVNSGDGSDVVARKFFEAGLVKDAHEFDLFLMEHGYDRKITVGNHKIKKNATREEMGLNLVSSTK